MSASRFIFSLPSCEHEYIPFPTPLVYTYTDCGCEGSGHTSTSVCGSHCFVPPPLPTPPATTPVQEATAYQSFPNVVNSRVCCECQDNCGYPPETIFTVDGYSVHMECECSVPHAVHFTHYAPAPAPATIDD
jgi:hypothetical protein